MKFYVYCHTNKISGKSYIGWTNKLPEQRWNIHCRAAKAGAKLLFAQAIRKYGTDVWHHEILDVLTTLKNVKQAERLWIAHRKTNHFRPDHHGYNMTDGGDGFLGPRKPKTLECCKAISEGKLRQYENPEERQKTSVAVRKAKETSLAHENACKAQTLRYSDPKNRLKMRESNTQKRPVRQLSRDGVVIKMFASISEAVQETKVLNVKLCCNGKRPFAGGFRWEYIEKEVVNG